MTTVFIWIACAFVCYGLANSKNRNPMLWAGVGILTGFIGVIVILCLPALPRGGGSLPPQ